MENYEDKNKKTIKILMIILGIILIILEIKCMCFTRVCSVVGAYDDMDYDNSYIEYYDNHLLIVNIELAITIISIILLNALEIISIVKKNFKFNRIYNFIFAGIYLLLNLTRNNSSTLGLYGIIFSIIALLGLVEFIWIIFNIIISVILKTINSIKMKKE